MKRILTLSLFLIYVLSLSAQRDVTQFLGIPVDGSKQAMIQKLKAKGFKYDASTDMLSGRFNGTDVHISIVTENGKVYRIAVVEDVENDEAGIKIRFNRLCNQFERNSKYINPKDYSQMLSDEENISYEMTVNAKRYEADYYQRGESVDGLAQRIVWFVIDKGYNSYRIILFYDNGRNQANGEDL